MRFYDHLRLVSQSGVKLTIHKSWDCNNVGPVGYLHDICPERIDTLVTIFHAHHTYEKQLGDANLMDRFIEKQNSV